MTRLLALLSTFICFSCDKSTFNLEQLKGTYSEVQTSHSKYKRECSLTITDTSLTLSNCILLKDFSGTKIKIIDNKLSYNVNNQTSTFEIVEKNGIIHLYQPVEENEDITFKKVE